MNETICFPSGLIGLEDCRSWVLLSEQPDDRFIWFQSTQQAEIALPLVDPRTFVPDFTLQVEESDWTPLGRREDDLVQVLVTLGQSHGGFVLNLLAPLVINCERRIGRQVFNHADAEVNYRLDAFSAALQRTA
ncbi:MAG: flagellar assembly protein FliW [Planctomycetota bacterium]|nr:flagellar assembly protein FliW [Planctomycetota bacterium]